MKSQTLEAYCAKDVLQIETPICAVKCPSHMSESGWPWHSLWNFLTINLKNKSFHNFLDWSGLYLQVCISSYTQNYFYL